MTKSKNSHKKLDILFIILTVRLNKHKIEWIYNKYRFNPKKGDHVFLFKNGRSLNDYKIDIIDNFEFVITFKYSLYIIKCLFERNLNLGKTTMS